MWWFICWVLIIIMAGWAEEDGWVRVDERKRKLPALAIQFKLYLVDWLSLCMCVCE